MSERPEDADQVDRPDEAGRHDQPAPRPAPPTSDVDDPDRKTLSFDFSFGSTRPLPPGALSPELIERLRSGTPPSAEDLAQIRLATEGQAGVAGMLLEAMTAAGFVKSEVVDAEALPVPAEFAGDPNVVVVPGSAQKFEWTWGGGTGSGGGSGGAGGMGASGAGDSVPDPATYFEALTGRPDPMRDVLVTARRTLDIITWILAIGLPVGLVLLAVVTGQSTETIFFAGFGGLVVGMMIKTTLPRTPFG